jgi:hypothetical protein
MNSNGGTRWPASNQDGCESLGHQGFLPDRFVPLVKDLFRLEAEFAQTSTLINPRYLGPANCFQ